MNFPSQFRTLRLASFAVALALTAAMAPTRAEAQEPVSAANIQYRKAFAAVEKKDWAEARRLLLPLWDKSHTWDVAIGLGKAEWYLNHRAAGARYMAFAVANIPPKEKPQVVEGLRAGLSEMKQGVGTVQVSVNKDSAEVLADGDIVGSSPINTDIFLDPGPHVLEARLGNAVSEKQTLDVAAGQSYTVALIVQTPAPTVSNTNANATPSSAALTASPNAAPPIAPEQTTNSTGPSPNWAPALITGGLAIVAVAVGTGFAVDASSAKSKGAEDLSSAESQFGTNPCAPQRASTGICQDLQSQQDRRSSSLTGATVSFVAGGVFAAAAVGSYFLWARPESNQTHVGAWVGPGAGGLRLQGSF